MAAPRALTPVEARRRIGTRELSSVELLGACIARIEAANPAVITVAATVVAGARVQARPAEALALSGEALPLLDGPPVGMADLDDPSGLLTSHGSPLHREHVPTRDEAMGGRVRAAGRARQRIRCSQSGVLARRTGLRR